jgi:putative membrane protein insertion efficiency factor
MDRLSFAIRYLTIAMIRVYQKTISFDHGLLKRFYPNGFCPYYPSCSEYAAQAIEKRGMTVGTVLVIWRLLRCNPFSKGGIDKVPEKRG